MEWNLQFSRQTYEKVDSPAGTSSTARSSFSLGSRSKKQREPPGHHGENYHSFNWHLTIFFSLGPGLVFLINKKRNEVKHFWLRDLFTGNRFSNETRLVDVTSLIYDHPCLLKSLQILLYHLLSFENASPCS
uniref:Uncharacterized protein n=1 Tax=Utricularia reniformis TaxID=192314 RepID=A0A1Y0B4M2_9LAMI|nr:hypothetical protein AEK19_MT2187 [Utricularia reniformis]ART32334.1 hypothetical protein AEK19_MT2187 [Utricularia reniformis]